MSIEEIEDAISKLPPKALTELADWFEEFHAAAWDKQLEKDVYAGRLSQQARQAKEDFASGACKPL